MKTELDNDKTTEKKQDGILLHFTCSAYVHKVFLHDVLMQRKCFVDLR